MRMGCSMSGLNALHDAAKGGGDVWINEHRFRVLHQIGEGDFAFIYIVRELNPPSDAALGKSTSHVSDPPGRSLQRALSLIFDFVFVSLLSVVG
jgi:serine/threonine kinase 16